MADVLNPIPKPAPAWRTKICPELAQAEIMGRAVGRALNGTPKLLGQSGEPSSPAPGLPACVGPGCMWFTATLDERGQKTGDGECAVTMMPIIASGMAHLAQALANHVVNGAAPKTVSH